MSDHLYKRGPVYWCWWYEGNPPRLIRRSTRCTDRDAAKLALKRFERQANAPRGSSARAAGHTLGEALAMLIEHGGEDVAPGTRDMRATKAGHLLRLLGDRDVNLLSRDDVQGYIEIRAAKPESAARSTIRKELSTLHAALNDAVARQRRSAEATNPIPRYRVRYVPRTRYLTVDEFAALLSAMVRVRRLDGEATPGEMTLQGRRRRWLILAVYTGGRASELAAVAWSDVAADWSGLTLPGTKTARARRWIPMHPVLRAELERTGRGTGPLAGSWGSVRRDLADACRRAGIAAVTPNDLRRTFASWMKQAGVDSKAVADLLGHASTRMVDLVYGHLDDAARRRAIARLPGCETGVKAPRRSVALPAPSGESASSRKHRRAP